MRSNNVHQYQDLTLVFWGCQLARGGIALWGNSRNDAKKGQIGIIKLAICEPKQMMTVVGGSSIVIVLINRNIPKVDIDSNILGVKNLVIG